jgi:RHS repeat-associated protein
MQKANGWLKDVKSGSSTIASYSYDYAGNRTLQANGNGTSTEYAYDSDSRYRVTSITHKRGTTTLATIGYPTRDNTGNPLSMTDWTGTWSYDYDANNRLDSATPPNPVPDQPAGGNYGYDWVGNRIHPPSDPNPMIYNKVDQLTGWPGMHTYTYYGDGSLHQVKGSTGTNVLRSYTYTPDGLLATSTYGGRTLTNTWDATGNRVRFVATSGSHTFVYDTTAGIPAVIQEDGVYYIREPGGSLIARISGSDTSYYHFDALGSTRLLTDSDGDVTDKYSYDAYGSLISHDELAGHVDQPYQYVGQLGYYTHWQEPNFGLMQLGVRFYDSETGRFTQGDPLGYFAGWNLYRYASANPLNSIDPSGLWDLGGWWRNFWDWLLGKGKSKVINYPTMQCRPTCKILQSGCQTHCSEQWADATSPKDTAKFMACNNWCNGAAMADCMASGKWPSTPKQYLPPNAPKYPKL